MDRVLRIAAVSVGSDDLLRLRQVVESSRAHLAATVRWVDATDADLLVIDVDSIAGHMDWVRARGHGRRIVALSSRPLGDGEVGIRRPMQEAAVVAALSHWVDDLGNGLPRVDHEAATPASTPAHGAVKPSAAPQVPRPAAVAASASVQTPPDATSAAAPVTADDEAPSPPAAAVALDLSLAEYCTPEALPQAARIVLGDAPALTIDNSEGVYYGPPGLKALEPYARATIPRAAWTPVSAAVLAGLRAAGGGQPTARLVWLSGLHAGQGRLLAIDGGTRVRLARWPQIEREFPRHFRIATVMMKGFATIDDIAAQSGAQAAEVADFVNACMAAGHAEAEAPAASAVPPAADAAGGGLLGRLGLRNRKG